MTATVILKFDSWRKFQHSRAIATAEGESITWDIASLFPRPHLPLPSNPCNSKLVAWQLHLSTSWFRRKIGIRHGNPQDKPVLIYENIRTKKILPSDKTTEYGFSQVTIQKCATPKNLDVPRSVQIRRKASSIMASFTSQEGVQQSKSRTTNDADNR